MKKILIKHAIYYGTPNILFLEYKYKIFGITIPIGFPEAHELNIETLNKLI